MEYFPKNLSLQPDGPRCISVANALQELSEEAVMSFDPLPPTDSIDLYKGDTRRGGGGTDDSGTLSLFLRSLIPNFDANAPAAQA